MRYERLSQILPRWALVALLAVVSWSAFLALWAVRPMVDHVPTGIIQETATTEDVTCHSPLSRNESVRGQLPEIDPPRAYQRTPCAGMIRQASLLLVFDGLFAVGVAAVICYWGARSARQGRTDEDSREIRTPAALG